MDKSKHEPTDYFALYNAALAAYAKTVLGANALMLGYTVAATRTMLRATALAAPVAPAAPEALHVASGPETELAQIEALLYDADARPNAAEAPVAEPAVHASTIERAKESLETTALPRSSGPKKAGTRRRRGKK